MAFARITRTDADGIVFEILLDSDLDTLADVATEAMRLWRESLVDEA